MTQATINAIAAHQIAHHVARQDARAERDPYLRSLNNAYSRQHKTALLALGGLPA